VTQQTGKIEKTEFLGKGNHSLDVKHYATVKTGICNMKRLGTNIKDKFRFRKLNKSIQHF
jgi:hypothetical protein